MTPTYYWVAVNLAYIFLISDYEIKGNSKNSLYNALSKKIKQADNFIFDISNTHYHLLKNFVLVFYLL